MMMSTLFVSAPCQADAFTVAAHASVPVDSVSTGELKKILTGQVRTWSDGTPVVLVLPPADSPALAWLCSTYLHIAPKVYLRYINEKVFRGALGEPTRVEDGNSAGAALAATAGAIGVSVPPAMVEGAKALTVQ